MASQTATTSIPTVASFVGSIGIGQDISSVADATQVASKLSYLGISHLRTDYTSSQNLLAAGSLGAKIDVITPWFMHPVASADIDSMITSTIKPAASVIEAVEGPNEVNNGDPDTFNGVGGPQGIIALQKYLYAAVKANPALSNASVYNFTVLQGTDMSAYAAMGNLADNNNVHAYGSAGIPAQWILPYEVGHNRIAGDKPVVLTEVGTTTIATVGVDEAMQARFDIEALLDAFKLGVSRTYLFNLRDWDPSSDTGNFSAHYGLYNVDGTPKLAAAALHNLTTILNQGTTTASASGTLSYNVIGLPYYGQQLLLSKGGGKYDLVLWNETNYWNSTSHTEQALATSKVTVSFGSAQTTSIYDPLTSMSTLSTSTSGTSVTVSLSKDPLIIEIGPTQLGGQLSKAARDSVDTTAAPVTRLFNSSTGMHFTTSSADEISALTSNNSSITSEGAIFGSLLSDDQTGAPVYRFFDSHTGDHFFTISGQESRSLQTSRPDMVYEGVAFNESTSATDGSSAVYRFFDQKTGTHLLTASSEESANIQANLPQFTYEGIAFYAPHS